ncbi:MAG: hypothetical protein BWK80_47365 [Desulfobacteraceae bacterium IS3]|nr:MAG: hypothetical protein BWK80_47365 [Desulfobacteraceae bacterium IS3]
MDETVFVSRKSRGPAITDLSKAKDLSVVVLHGSSLQAKLKELNFQHINGGGTEMESATALARNRYCLVCCGNGCSVCVQAGRVCP